MEVSFSQGSRKDFFRNVTDMEYNFLIKELLGQGFSNFSNIKDEKILDLVKILQRKFATDFS